MQRSRKWKKFYNIHSRSSLDLVEWAAFHTIDWVRIFAYWSLVLSIRVNQILLYLKALFGFPSPFGGWDLFLLHASTVDSPGKIFKGGHSSGRSATRVFFWYLGRIASCSPPGAIILTFVFTSGNLGPRARPSCTSCTWPSITMLAGGLVITLECPVLGRVINKNGPVSLVCLVSASQSQPLVCLRRGCLILLIARSLDGVFRDCFAFDFSTFLPFR